jgi:hypothetical protein
MGFYAIRGDGEETAKAPRTEGATRGLAYGEEHRARHEPKHGARPPQALIVRLEPGGVNGNRPRLNRLSERAFCELRTPHRKLPNTGSLLSGCRDTVEFLSDDSGCYGSDAVEPLKLASDSPELIASLDVLSIEHIPGKPR